VALDFPAEAQVSETSFSSVDAILDQTYCHKHPLYSTHDQGR
jgi:hypothetical protein